MKKLPKPWQILSKAFERKKRKNPSYSLRALARDLNLSPSHVSRILNGEKSFSPRSLDKFKKVLEMDEMSATLLKKSLKEAQKHAEIFSDENSKEAKENLFFDFEEAHAKLYNVLNHWYNIAILDLTTCADFQSNPSWISKKLGVSEKQVVESINYLQSLGLLELKDQTLSKTKKQIRFPTSLSIPVVRNYHKQSLQLAFKKLSDEAEAKFADRLISGLSLAGNPKNLEAVRKFLHTSLYQAALMLAEGDCTEVYHLNLQLFPVTK